MTRPPRWRDQGPDDVRDLLRHAAKTRDFSPEDRARTRRRVAQLGGVAAVAAGLSLVQSAALGAGLAVVTLVTVEIGTTWLAPSPPSPRPAPSSLVLAPASPAMSVASASPLVPQPPTVGSAVPRSSARRLEAPPLPEDPPALPSARAPDSLAEEAALIERARASLASSPTEALARTQEHAAQFPAGKLTMERELVAIDALARLGRRPEARARAESLLERARGGLYEPRLRQLLDGLR